MRNQGKKKQKEKITLEDAIKPVVNCAIPFWEQRLILSEMFATTVANAPDNETDNFSAKRIKPFFLGILEMLENFEKIDDIVISNHYMLLND